MHLRPGRVHVLHDVPHHDGSETYVPSGTPRLGDTVPVRLRVPRSSGAPAVGGEHAVRLRVVQDGEPRILPARVDRRTDHETWYVAEVPVHNPVTSYRFFLGAPDGSGYRWLTGRGPVGREVPDAHDFRLTTHPTAPGWARGSLVYQVFPDRFARSGRVDLPAPDWAVPRAWDDPVDGFGPGRGRQLFGGDLWGVRDRLDHLQDLGVDVLYLTPVFPGRSNHRYDASTFDAVDPLLGGDAALAALSADVHRRGMHLVGDLTTNHTGVAHDWFRTAQADPTSPERDFYYWDADGRHVGWLGHPSLPKLRYAAPGLAERVVAGPTSVAARWLQPPFDLDGWRVDVANMTGRHGAEDAAHEVARRMRATLAEARADALLVGEHFHDASADAQGDGWHAVMNYAAFTRPAWAWLSDGRTASLELPGAIVRRPGARVVATMRDFDARVPWAVTAAQWNLLDSHDTARLRTIAGSSEVAAVGAALLFTYPGTPVVFAGDEYGLEGRNGEESRVPMPWDRPADRDERTLATYRGLAALRRSSRALREGGLRWLVVADDALAFVRETADERVLVLLARAPWSGARVPVGDLLGEPGTEGTSAGPHTLYGPVDLRLEESAGAGRALVLPGDGPVACVWRLA